MADAGVTSKVEAMKLSDHETSQWVGEVLTEKGPKYLLVTQSCIYFITLSPAGSGVMDGVYSILDVYNVSTDDSDLFIEFSTEEMTMSLSQPEDLKRIIIKQQTSIVTGIPTRYIRGAYVIRNSNEIPVQSGTSMKRVEVFKYISIAVSKDRPVVKSIADSIANSDDTVTFIDCDCDDPLAVNMWFECNPKLRKVILRNSLITVFSDILRELIYTNSHIRAIGFEDYENSEFPIPAYEQKLESQLESIDFTGCSADFVSFFFERVSVPYMTIDTIVLTSIEITHRTMLAIHQSLILKHLKTIVFDGCPGSEDFFCYDNSTIESVKLRRNELSSLQTLRNIVTRVKHIQSLTIENGVFLEKLPDDFVFPSALLALNMGSSKWSEDVLVHFIKRMTFANRGLPLSLDISNSDTDINKVIEVIAEEEVYPTLFEINLDGNLITTGAFQKFIDKQRNLQYISLNGSLQDPRVFRLDKVCGLSLQGDFQSDDSIIDFLDGIKQLVFLDISNNKLTRESGDKLLQMINRVSLSEICVDNCEFGDRDETIRFYREVVAAPSIHAIQCPVHDLEVYSNNREVRRIIERTKAMKGYSNIAERMGMYINLCGDFSTKFVDISSLFKKRFANPFPSIAAISNDVEEIDPLAKLVTEYVATSEESTSFPPTVPPMYEDDTDFIAPCIFQTIDPEDEEAPMILDDLTEESVSIAEFFNKV